MYKFRVLLNLGFGEPAFSPLIPVVFVVSPVSVIKSHPHKGHREKFLIEGAFEVFWLNFRCFSSCPFGYTSWALPTYIARLVLSLSLSIFPLSLSLFFFFLSLSLFFLSLSPSIHQDG